MLKELAWRAMVRLNLAAPYALMTRGALAERGWFRSFNAQRSVDADGKPLPFISYPAMEFLSRRVQPDFSVFEFGAGGSTLWWSTRVARVVSVEHDGGWYREIHHQLPPNVTLDLIALEPGGAYSRRAADCGATFDVIVVDGRDRVNCALNSLGALTPRGVLVWDDSQRPRYQDGERVLIERGFRKLEFVGIGPMDPDSKETSIFYRPGNCLDI